MIVVGVDIGTTHIKAAAINHNGSLLAVVQRHNSTISPRPGHQEQDPEAIFRLTSSALKALLKQASIADMPIQAVVFSAAMHGLTATDKNNHVLCPVWIWSDTRASVEAQQLIKSNPAIYQATGVPIHPMSPMVKLRWMQKHTSAIFKQAAHFYDIKSYVWKRLTGRFENDFGCASASGLLNIHHKIWEPAALTWASVDENQLPKPVSTRHAAFYNGADPLLKKRLHQVPLVIGSSDGAMANLGSGAVDSGQIAITIGTSAAIRGVFAQPTFDKQMRTFCYCLDDDRYIVGGASNNGANVLEWVRQLLFSRRYKMEEMIRQGMLTAPGAEGLTFTPHLLGERAPIWTPKAVANLTGLRSRHTYRHFIRAAMEGVLYNIKLISEALPEPIQTIHASGGFSKSADWVQMLADVFQKPVEIQQDGLDASLAGGVLHFLQQKNFSSAKTLSTVQPNPAFADSYEAAFQKFCKAARIQREL
ncbi:MAG: gluconokinase [Saprospiraceae bacterium]|nr:gluconokinase [Saprospiraceae bacterium]